MKYDPNLFVEIIESIQGIVYLREDSLDGVHIRFYQGLKGNLVVIDTSDDCLPDGLAKSYLTQLGIEDLIPALFPEEKKG